MERLLQLLLNPIIVKRNASRYAVSGDSKSINSSSYPIRPILGDCEQQDDVPEDFAKFRNVDTSSRRDLRRVFLTYRTRRHLRLDAPAFDAVSPWALF